MVVVNFNTTHGYHVAATMLDQARMTIIKSAFATANALGVQVDASAKALFEFS